MFAMRNLTGDHMRAVLQTHDLEGLHGLVGQLAVVQGRLPEAEGVALATLHCHSDVFHQRHRQHDTGDLKRAG